MKNLISIAICVSSLLSMVGCYQEEQTAGGQTTFNVQAIVDDKSIDDVTRAERLSLVGEQLATPSGFMYANEVLNLALAFDSKNRRAQIYKHLLAPELLLKGVIARLEPVRGQFSSRVRENFDAFVSKVHLNKSVDKFFNDGRPDLTNESSIQMLVEKIRAKQNNLRVYIASMKDTTIQLQPLINNRPLEVVWAACPVEAKTPHNSYHETYVAENCSALSKTMFLMEGADWEAIQHVAAGMQIASSVSLGYDLTGAIAYERLVNDGHSSNEQRLQSLHNSQRLGQLRQAEKLQMVRAMGTDFYAGARWFQRYQRELCPTGQVTPNQRPNNLFGDGICVNDHTLNKPIDFVFSLVETVLAGQTIGILTQNGAVDVIDPLISQPADYKTQANLMAPLVNPVADLKSILPARLDKCGQVTTLGDSTAAGLFPQGDAVTVAKRLRIISQSCQ